MFPVTQTTPHDIVLPKPVPITSLSPTQHSHSMTQLSPPTTSYSTRAPTWPFFRDTSWFGTATLSAA